MSPFLDPGRERATAAPVSDPAEGDAGHARAGKWPVSEYGRKRRRLPLREVPGLLCQRGARAQSVRAHLPLRNTRRSKRHLVLDLNARWARTDCALAPR